MFKHPLVSDPSLIPLYQQNLKSPGWRMLMVQLAQNVYVQKCLNITRGVIKETGKVRFGIAKRNDFSIPQFVGDPRHTNN